MKDKKEYTIYDIAKELNLSTSTVSRGLNDNPNVRKETKRKIIEKARMMGYQRNRFASNLRQNKSFTIGIIVPRLNSYFMSRVISGIEKEVSSSGYNLIINQTDESIKKERNSISTMYNSRVDALIISLSSKTKNLNHLQIFFDRNIPVVFFDRVIKPCNCVHIVIDNYKAGYEATKHLIDQGCRRIIHLGGNLNRNVYIDRFNGYKKALEDHGISYYKFLNFSNDLNEMTGIKTVEYILGMEELPDGIFTANDTTAATVICKLKKAGIKIPEDIAVVGFNNDLVSRVVEPNLTTINYPGVEMGEIAAQTVLGKLENDHSNYTGNIMLEHKLIVRGSSIKKKIRLK